MGGATARYLAAAGLRVVGLCDVEGVVVNPAGLDVERLLGARTAQGTIDRRALASGDEELAGDRWLEVQTDVLVPAAMSYVLTGAVAGEVSARLVVEAANVATDAEAERSLAGSGVVVVPDVVANLATNAWWWWTFFGDIAPDASASFAKIDATMDRLVGDLLSRSRDQGILPRAAALQIAAENLERMGSANPAEMLAPATVAVEWG
jgi:glutamate dehydrogenase (NAD(P)+)